MAEARPKQRSAVDCQASSQGTSGAEHSAPEVLIVCSRLPVVCLVSLVSGTAKLPAVSRHSTSTVTTWSWHLVKPTQRLRQTWLRPHRYVSTVPSLSNEDEKIAVEIEGFNSLEAA